MGVLKHRAGFAVLPILFFLAASQVAAQPAVQSFRDCKDVCPEMIALPGGSFVMGAPKGEGIEPLARWGVWQSLEDADKLTRVQHSVNITKFAVGKYPVTRAEFAAFAQETGFQPNGNCQLLSVRNRDKKTLYTWRNPGFSQTDRDPAVCINWNDAKAYVAWISRKTGHTYRLLSEAEWEYAARAGTTTRYYWGDDSTKVCHYANIFGLQDPKQFISKGLGIDKYFFHCSDGYANTSPVGHYPPNPFGLYDMIGNVTEWNEDCWVTYEKKIAATPAEPLSAPHEENSCDYRSARGADYSSMDRWDTRVAGRGREHPDERWNSMGFRVARDL